MNQSNRPTTPNSGDVNSQHLVNPLVCLGDGHDNVWNLVKEFAIASVVCISARWRSRSES
ncbi:hypothetical protein [Nostoc sp. ChiQUE02]|uniref:hypothetical protein n=1 Tax=Nostoc sp. ChiQUE02 TaxID=3075377 RepID=UPI003D160B57